MWKRPQVRLGGTYFIYPIGDIEVVSIDEVAAVDREDLSVTGFDSLAALEKALGETGERQLYRVAFEFKGPRARPESPLDEQPVDAGSFAKLEADLDRKDARAVRPWTRQLLTLIGDGPGESSAVLAEALGAERLKLKQDVRKLKKLGLTISLETGYQLSVRGRSYLEQWQGRS